MTAGGAVGGISPDGSGGVPAAVDTVFRPGLFVVVRRVGVLWVLALVALGRGARRLQEAPPQHTDRFLAGAVVVCLALGGAVLVRLTVRTVLTAVRTSVRIGGGEVLVRVPGAPERRFVRGGAQARGHATLVDDGGPPVDLPTWWLSVPDVDRLLASVESELGVRFPERPPAARPRSRRRGSVEW